MHSFLNTLQINDTIVYSVYGQVFFSLGLVAALYLRRQSQLVLSRQLIWLAAFGFSHGLHEWAHVFIPIQASYLPESSVALLNAGRIALLALSFFFLGQFGALVAFSNPQWQRAARVFFAFMLLAWMAWALVLSGSVDGTLFAATQAWIRRLMGFSAAALAALGMLSHARSVEREGLFNIGRDFRLAGISFGAYALLAGFLVSSQYLPPDQWPAYQLTLEFLGVPAPVLRSFAGLGVVLGIVRGLRIFEIESDRRLEEAERARFQSSERARRAMESMATTVSEHRDLAQLSRAALDQAMALAGTKAGWLVLDVNGPGTVQVAASRGLRPTKSHHAVCSLDERCPCRQILASGRTIVSSSTQGCALSASDELDTRWAAIPLTARNRAVGVMQLVGGDLGPEMLALLTSLGKQVGMAVESAELAREVARKEVARAQLLKKVITAQEEERQRVARELHDQTGQSLIAVIMALGAVTDQMDREPRQVAAMVDETRQVAVQALESTREMILGLRPAALDDLGLVPALRRFSEDLAKKGDLEIHVDGNGLSRRLPADVELVMFRILQESLNNILRHSRAQRAAVHLVCSEGEVQAEVWDDGMGFDIAEAVARPDSGRGLGLIGMKERAHLLGGDVMVESAPGQGTRVLVSLPLGGEAAA